MCWTGDDTAVRKIAERDFYVYKIGKIIWNNIFISDIRRHYYAPIRPNKIVPLIAYSPCIGVYRIDRGYHSYKWVALDDTYPNFRCLGNYNSALKENISLYKAGYFAVGVFAMIWAVLWALNIAKYNTIIQL